MHIASVFSCAEMVTGIKYVQSRNHGGLMSLVRLLGFQTVGCGCKLGRYRELDTGREVTYCEEKGAKCKDNDHERNQVVKK